MTPWITVAIVACALVHGDNNIPAAQREQIARVEAQAFMASATLHVSVRTLIDIGYVETRFDPDGSQRDRDGGFWGLMQIAEHAMNCWRTERITSRVGRHHRLHVRYIRHDDPTRCTPEQTARRAQLLDPVWNIHHAASMLETAWSRAHAHTSRRQARAIAAGWEGAYYWGSVPRRRRDLRRYMAYARRVDRANAIMTHRLEQCRDPVLHARVGPVD